jgi:glucose-6-phosphate 1-epimerase
MLLTNSTQIITRKSIQVLQIDNALGFAEIALFGGHILSFTPKHDGRERLWVSENAIYDGKKAIRGGVPICWPWFGDHKSDEFGAHGYVRDQAWHIVQSQDSELGTLVTLQPATTQGLGFDGQTELTLTVLVGKTLTIQLNSKNIGETNTSINCALHTYFAVSDINQTHLSGLQGKYLDKTRDFDSFDTPSNYQFNEETDRVHLFKASEVTIHDQQTETSVLSEGHDSIVVWNPWQEKSISMADMADDSYLTMLCVETAVTQGQILSPGQVHTLQQIIR